MTNRFQFIEDHHRAWGVKRLCAVLEVARSSFCKWRAGREAALPVSGRTPRSPGGSGPSTPSGTAPTAAPGSPPSCATRASA